MEIAFEVPLFASMLVLIVGYTHDLIINTRKWYQKRHRPNYKVLTFYYKFVIFHSTKADFIVIKNIKFSAPTGNI